MERNPHVILENVGDVVFAHIEKRGQGVQAQILIQMAVHIIADIQVENIFVDRGFLVQAVVENAVDVDQEGHDGQGRGLPGKGAAAGELLHHVGEPPQNVLSGDVVRVEPVGLVSLGVVHRVGHILVVGAQTAVKALADPQHETAVRALVIPKETFSWNALLQNGKMGAVGPAPFFCLWG